MKISPRLRNLWLQLQDEGLLDEMALVLQQRYFDQWIETEEYEQIERIRLKAQMVDEMLTEFSAIIDFDRETEE